MIYEWGVRNFLPVSMKIKLITIFLLLHTLVFGALSERLTVAYPTPPDKDCKIKILMINKAKYVSARDFAKAFNVRTYFQKESGKIVLFFTKKKIKITVNNSFVMFDAQVFQMTGPALLIDEDIYVPATSFLELVKQNTIPSLQYSVTTSAEPYYIKENTVVHAATVVAQPGRRHSQNVNLTGIRYKEKANGVTVRIAAKGTFKDSDFSTFFKGNNWFYLTIYGAECDSLTLSSVNPTNAFQRVEAIATGSSVQLGFRLNRQFKSADVHYDLRSGSILVSLFLPLNRDIKRKIEEAKTAWIIDTIVLDPGHGGKDPGTPGRWGYMHEKDIVLDVALRIGRLLKKKKNLKVVYTRKTDVFIPLWKRPEIANKSGGKLFISLHVNGLANNHTANGMEIYLLRPGRSEDAIRVAEAENAVIQLEEPEDKVKYQGYDDITNILANMVHSVNMRDSELVAGILSRNFTQHVNQKNRGVKQAGFYVLVDADMPKLLCELGFNSNKAEARKLNSGKHRQKIAEAIYRSILEFKEVCDKSVSQK